MRKITKEAIDAFEMGVKFRKSNTEVRVIRGTVYLSLHGNVIAKRYFDKPDVLEVTHSGWKTNTTKERLNGLNGVEIFQKNWEWFLNGKPMKSGWNVVTR